jgi:glycosyltransferase A (GT-A) superfamily protein (DUF2064 family)
LVYPRDEEGGGRELIELLGAPRAAALTQVLVRAAASWAAGVAPGRFHVAYPGARRDDELRTLVGPEARLVPQDCPSEPGSLRDAVHHVLAQDAAGPILVVWPELPRWRADHATGALGDLAAGCDVSFGPVFDGGFYLLGLRGPTPSLFELSGTAWRNPDTMGLALTAIQEAGLEVGLLRAERGLRRAADVRAALADPLTDPELVSILRGG